MGLQNEFENALQEPVFKNRVDYLQKYLSKQDSSMREYMLHLLLFAIIMENVTLFAYFASMKSFRKKHNLLKEIDSIIDATRLMVP